MDEANIWALFFASVVSMQYHPGAGRGGAIKLNVRECADVADEMLNCWYIRRAQLCRGLPEQSLVD